MVDKVDGKEAKVEQAQEPPSKKKISKQRYEEELARLQVELVKLQEWIKEKGLRVVVLFEGRDAAGKGGVIKRITLRLNPRIVRVVALGTPTEKEKTQWWFQRYVAELPAAGEMVLFDRSWYNRAGVERVMGYCSEAEYRRFLKQAPLFEKMLTDDGILLCKYWLAVDQSVQEARFAERAGNPLKRWKISPIDLEARQRYAEYGRARGAMFEATHRRHAPWHVVEFNDQRRGRLDLIAHLLEQVPYRRLKEAPLELPPLVGKPSRERYRGPVRPIRARY